MKLYWRFHKTSEVVKRVFKMENQLDFVSKRSIEKIGLLEKKSQW